MNNESEKYLDVEETEEAEEQEQDNISYDINYYPADITLKGYLDKNESEQLVFPDFQRQYVWDQVRASKLIESFLLGLPVPGVFLYKERNTNKLKIIDGQQRIMTAIQFFKGQFGDIAFRLKNVHERWVGEKFDELPESDQFQLHDSVLRATIVQQLNPEDDSSIYHIFERLNTGGLNLTPMEIRKCTYAGDMMKMLEELNTNTEWRLLIGRRTPDKRMRDSEWILRILAFHKHGDHYEKPMKTFLSAYLRESNKQPEVKLADEITKTKEVFVRTCKFILKEFGEKPFQVKNRFNYAVLDSVFCTCIQAMEKDIKGIKLKYEKLKGDEEFIKNVTANTSDQTVVVKRFEKAREYLLSD
jgi:hypothetical protein